MALPTLASLDHITPSGTITNLIPDFLSAPVFTDVGTGEVRTAVIVISANNGKYITNGPAIVDGYDLIYMAFIDDKNQIFNHVYEVILTVPVETKTSGTKLELHLLGIEHNLQKINYIKPWYGAGAYSVATDIINYYNGNKGSKQPKVFGITQTNITLPDWTLNNYDYGLNQETCYNRLLQLIDKMGNSVGGGGILDFFELDAQATSGSLVPPTLQLTITSSGSNDSGVIIQNTNSVNVGPTEGGIQAPKGYLVCGWGDAQSGSLHPDWSRFSSQEVMFGLHPQWDSSVNYFTGALVQFINIHYQCISNILGFGPHPPPGSDSFHWGIVTQNTLFGNTITYSYFTRNNQQLWKNSGSNPNNLAGSSGIQGIGFYDGNLVVWDDTSFRTWVNCKATQATDITSSSLSHLLYGGTDFYRGFRVLVNTSTPGAPWAGVDINGNVFANSVIEYDGAEWIVKYRNEASIGAITASLYDGACYKFSGSVWSDVTGQPNGMDCFHPWTNFSNIAGIYGVFDSFGVQTSDTSYTENTNSALRVEYQWSTVNNGDTSKTWYQAGAWINFSLPFPENNFGGIGQAVGQLYGGAIQSGGVPDSNKEPATLDAENMHLTHDGYRGFNKASAIDYGNISSIDFHIRIWYQSPTSLTIGLQPDWTKPVYNIQAANFQMRCVIEDTSDNEIFQDFQVPFIGNWTPSKLPLDGFQLYRARKPIKNVFSTIIPPKALDSNNVFEWRNIKRISIYTLDSYDSNGRYLPYDVAGTFGAGSKFYSPSVNDAASGLPVPFAQFRRIMMDIDSFRFTKPLFTTTGVVTDRNIEPDFIERPTFILYDNLSNDCFSQLAINKFRHLEYDLETTGSFKVKHGDTLYIYNTRLVPNRLSDGTPVPVTNASGSGSLLYPNSQMPANVTSDPTKHRIWAVGSGGDGLDYYHNTEKLVAKRIEYSLTKPSDAPGGFIRKLIGIKRFVA